MKPIQLLAVRLLVAVLTFGTAQAASLPIPDGVYVTKPEFCEDIPRGELEMIDFEVSEGGASFSYPESLCVVAEVTKVRDNRYGITGDCNEFGEIWQSSFFLDVLSDNQVALYGQPHQLCVGGSSDHADGAIALLDEWFHWNELCRGGSGDEATTWETCDKRSEIAAKRKEANLCYDRESDASRAEYDWHTCDIGSIHIVE